VTSFSPWHSFQLNGRWLVRRESGDRRRRQFYGNPAAIPFETESKAIEAAERMNKYTESWEPRA
jgi:hypothetical protein